MLIFFSCLGQRRTVHLAPVSDFYLEARFVFLALCRIARDVGQTFKLTLRFDGFGKHLDCDSLVRCKGGFCDLYRRALRRLNLHPTIIGLHLLERTLYGLDVRL